MDANAGAVMLAMSGVALGAAAAGAWCGWRDHQWRTTLRIVVTAALAGAVLVLTALAIHRGGMAWVDALGALLAAAVAGVFPLVLGGGAGFLAGRILQGLRRHKPTDPVAKRGDNGPLPD
ncbi:MAG: hypothetical protein JNK75_09430 [Betaproteobacteria bacterium]|nr:hypothetical protein [Betaproteobacteria bacterium]